MSNSYNICCPIKTKTVSPKSMRKPWITSEILNNIRKKNSYLLLYRQSKISSYYYNRFKNFVTSQIRNSKKTYYRRQFELYKDNIKNSWRLVNSIIRPKGSSNNPVNKLVVDGNIYEGEGEMSEIFNDFFTSIGSRIAESIPPCNINPLSYMSGDYPSSFFMRPVSTVEIASIIMSLKNKSSEISVIPVKVLKFLSPIISPILSSLVNKSFSFGTFPDSLKIAKVIPISKPGDKSNVSNYRPISILPTFSKVFEKAAYSQLYEYLNINNILCRDQYGFRRERSTIQAIVQQIQYVFDRVDGGNAVFSLFLDFKKAFDTVDHRILLSKLNYYGVRGLTYSWFESYLNNRKQFTSVGNSKSQTKLIKFGVPQGSVLGPLLFLVFINDIANISTLFKFTLFADDSTMSTPFKPSNIVNFASVINSELQELSGWLLANKMSLNIDKTNFMIFTYSNMKLMIPPIIIGDSLVNESDFVKFLGVFIDNRLNFLEHSRHISRKISKSIGIIYKLGKFLDSDILEMLYRSFVFPYLSYGIEIWHGSSANVHKPVNVLQKRACRAIFKLSYDSHTSTYFKQMDSLKLSDLYTFQIGVMMYKTLFMSQNNNIFDNLQTLGSLHDYGTRNRELFVIPKYCRSMTQRSFIYRAASLWNSLPISLRQSTSLNLFKFRLRSHLTSTY